MTISLHSDHLNEVVIVDATVTIIRSFQSQPGKLRVKSLYCKVSNVELVRRLWNGKPKVSKLEGIVIISENLRHVSKIRIFR